MVLRLIYGFAILLVSSANAQVNFVEIGATAGVANNGETRTVAWGDYNGDGYPDLYVTNHNSANKLYSNNSGNGTFADVGATGGVDYNGLGAAGAAWGDYNNDGHPDIYVAYGSGSNKFYHNNGDSTFVDMAPTFGMDDSGSSTSVAWADFNSDGYIDLYVGNSSSANRLYRNTGGSAFSEIAASAGAADSGVANSLAWGDCDGNGLIDLYVGSNGGNILYRNNGDETFTNIAASVGVNGSSLGVGAVTWSDYDRDGDLDLYVARSSQTNWLYQNQGNCTFVEVGASAGLNLGGDELSTAWGDYDNDGDLDMYVAVHRSANGLYDNDGSGQFSNIAPALGVADNGGGRGSAWADFDGDGDLDIYIGNDHHIDGIINRLYRNDGPVGNWLHVKAVGTTSNRDAIGAQITAVTGTKRQRVDVDGGSSYFSQASRSVEFGLGSSTTVDSLIVHWPSGATTVKKNVAVNDTITLLEVYGQPEAISHKWDYALSRAPLGGFSADENGRLYVTTHNPSTVHCIDSTGAHIWSLELAPDPLSNHAGGPVIGPGDSLYVTVGNGYNNTGALHALKKDGTYLWSFNINSVGNVVPVVADDGTIYTGGIGSGTKILYAVNPDGTEKWSHALSTLGEGVHLLAISPQGQILLGTGSGSDGALYAFNNQTGVIEWQIPFGTDLMNVQGLALDNDGNIYLTQWTSPTTAAQLSKVSADGNILWHYPTNRGAWGPAIAADGTIAIGVQDGTLHVVNPDGTAKWVYTYDRGLALGSPTIGDNGTIYVRTAVTLATNYLLAISPNGQLLNEVVTPDQREYGIRFSPVIVDGTLYFETYVPDFIQAYSVEAQGLADSPWPKRYRDNAFTSNALSEISISIPDLTSLYNRGIEIPVSLVVPPNSNTVSAELFIAFDSDLLTPSSSPVSSTTMTSAWTIETNVVEGNGTPIDTLKIAMADEVALSGSGDLLTLHFDVADIRVPYTSPLELVHVLFNDGAPGAVPTDGSVKLIGTTATTGVTPISATVIPRETITIKINDIDENTDSGSVQQFDVTVVNGAQVETLTLLEQGNDTDLFSATINTVFSLASTSAASSGDGIIQAKAGDEITFLYDDQLFGNGDGPVELHQEVGVIGGADGSVQSTVVAQPGDTVRVKVVDADMSGSVNVRVDNPRSGALEWLVLPEFSSGSSTFYGRFFTDEGAEVFGDSTLSILDCDTLLISYYDDVTALGDSTTLVSQTNGVVPFGDADDDGQSIAFDAALTLKHVLIPYLPLWDSLSVNVDTQAPFGPITPYDASLILQKRVGLIDRFPVQTPIAINHPQPETSLQPGPKLVPEARELSLRAGAGYLSVWAEDRADILSGDMLIAGIEGKVQAGEELGGFLVESRPTDRGLRIVFAGAEAVSGSGELLRLYGVGPEGAQLVRASFNDGRLVSNIELGPMQVVPATYALHANVPNPFNPETQIAFDLSSDSAVRLEIYDVLGQQVRVLVSKQLSAGAHRVLWDGRDSHDMQVASGAYFYRLQAGEFVQTRRMLLLK